VYGQDVFNVSTPKQIYELFGEALAAYQSSGEVCAFSSKYDASKYGTPPRNLYTLSASEGRGRQLFFGQAQCSACHSSATIPAIQAITQGKETFTIFCNMSKHTEFLYVKHLTHVILSADRRIEGEVYTVNHAESGLLLYP
jgi:hypothetical protein